MVRLSTRISSQRFPNDDRGYIVKNVLQANGQANTVKNMFFVSRFVSCSCGYMCAQADGFKETLGGNMCFTVVAGSLI